MKCARNFYCLLHTFFIVCCTLYLFFQVALIYLVVSIYPGIPLSRIAALRLTAVVRAEL